MPLPGEKFEPFTFDRSGKEGPLEEKMLSLFERFVDNTVGKKFRHLEEIQKGGFDVMTPLERLKTKVFIGGSRLETKVTAKIPELQVQDDRPLSDDLMMFVDEIWLDGRETPSMEALQKAQAGLSDMFPQESQQKQKQFAGGFLELLRTNQADGVGAGERSVRIQNTVEMALDDSMRRKMRALGGKSGERFGKLFDFIDKQRYGAIQDPIGSGKEIVDTLFASMATAKKVTTV